MSDYRNVICIQPGLTLLCAPSLALELDQILESQKFLSPSLRDLHTILAAQLAACTGKEEKPLAA